MMQAPQQEGQRQDAGTGRADRLPVAEEHPAGPERGEAEEEDGGTGGEEEVVQLVDRDVRPQEREERRQQVHGTPAHLAREDERRPEEGECRPTGDHLVPVEPGPVAGEKETHDRAKAEHVQCPRSGVPGEVVLAVALIEECAEQRQAAGDGGLEDRRVELERGGQRDGGLHCPNQAAPCRCFQLGSSPDARRIRSDPDWGKSRWCRYLTASRIGLRRRPSGGTLGRHIYVYDLADFAPRTVHPAVWGSGRAPARRPVQ